MCNATTAAGCNPAGSCSLPGLYTTEACSQAGLYTTEACVLPTGSCSRPGRAPSRVYILLKRACSLPCRATSRLAYVQMRVQYMHSRIVSLQRDIAQYAYIPARASACKAKAHSGAVSPRGTSVRLHTSECKPGVHAASSRTSVRLHTSACDPGGHRYAYTPAGANPAHTKTQKRVMAPFTPAGHRAVGLHTGARAGHNAPRSHSPTCASPSTPARTPAQTPPRPLSRAFQPPAPPPSYRNILVRRLTSPQTPHASLRRALQPRSVPSLRAAPRAPSLSRQTL